MISQEVLNKIRRIQIFTRKIVTDLFSGEYESAFKGKGIEFEEVREYVPGDDVRAIDWNVTARTSIPHIKRYREERELTIYFAVDLSGSGLLSYNNKTRNEFSAELVAALSFVANVNNDRTALIVFTDEVELFVPPGKGLRHILRMIRELLVYKPKSNKTSISAALEYAFRVADRRSIVFLISDFYDDNWSDKARRLSIKHDLINIAVRDKREIELPPAGIIDITDPETGGKIRINAANPKIRKAFKINSFRRNEELKKSSMMIGADYLMLCAQEDWVNELAKFFKKRERRRA